MITNKDLCTIINSCSEWTNAKKTDSWWDSSDNYDYRKDKSEDELWEEEERRLEKVKKTHQEEIKRLEAEIAEAKADHDKFLKQKRALDAEAAKAVAKSFQKDIAREKKKQNTLKRKLAQTEADTGALQDKLDQLMEAKAKLDNIGLQLEQALKDTADDHQKRTEEIEFQEQQLKEREERHEATYRERARWIATQQAELDQREAELKKREIKIQKKEQGNKPLAFGDSGKTKLDLG